MIDHVAAQIHTKTYDQPGLRQHWISVAPLDSSDYIEDQVASIYDGLEAALDDLGAEYADIVTERFYCRSVDEASPVLDRARVRWPAPAAPTMRIEQPPVSSSRHLEYQAYVVKPSEGMTRLPDLPEGVEGVAYATGGAQYVHLSGLTGVQAGKPASFAEEARLMFDRAEATLQKAGFSFPEVVRTWIYLPLMEEDYGTFNPVRTAFFKEVGVERIPASTGIQGAVHPSKRGPGMDLLAVRPDAGTQISVMQSPTMNEAWSYGSVFSRGMRVAAGGGSLAYLSGTASIDEQGQIVGEGDIETQLGRMFLNVEGLLDSVQGSFEDLVCATVYLKDREYVSAFELLNQIPDSIPLSVVVADVCRPGWLCEMDAIAAVGDR